LQFRLFKKEPAQAGPSLIATLAKREFLDEAIDYGRAYTYSVQAFVKTGETEAISESNGEASLTPKDTFPPAKPTGLTALAGTQSIELAWDRSTDFDFRLYRVYRAVGDGEFARLVETGAAPAYGDRQIQSGQRYRYAVTAIDERGNESARSEPVEARIN
jgi:fibronectin type 3 domain-containing protein